MDRPFLCVFDVYEVYRVKLNIFDTLNTAEYLLRDISNDLSTQYNYTD